MRMAPTHAGRKQVFKRGPRRIMPQSQNYNPHDRAIAQTVYTLVADPIAGANLPILTAAYRTESMVAIMFRFVADGNAANRWISLSVADGATNTILGITDTAITAGNTHDITMSVGIYPSEPVAGAYRFVPITGGIYIPALQHWDLVVTNLQATDQISNIYTWRDTLHGW